MIKQDSLQAQNLVSKDDFPHIRDVHPLVEKCTYLVDLLWYVTSRTIVSTVFKSHFYSCVQKMEWEKRTHRHPSVIQNTDDITSKTTVYSESSLALQLKTTSTDSRPSRSVNRHQALTCASRHEPKKLHSHPQGQTFSSRSPTNIRQKKKNRNRNQ